MINMNEIAVEISTMEGGRVSLPIAQIKEVLKCVAILTAKNPMVIATIVKAGMVRKRSEENLALLRADAKPLRKRRGAKA